MIIREIRSQSGDKRGLSFPVGDGLNAFLALARDCHITTIAPNCTRGNHFHRERGELLIVLYRDAWELYWDEGEGTEPQQRSFSGEGLVTIEVAREYSHALRNSGNQDLFVVGLSTGPYDPDAPDAYVRRVSPE